MRQEASKLRLGAFYAVYLLLIGAVFFRMIPHYFKTPYQWVIIGLLLTFLVLFLSERLITKKPDGFIQATFVLELAIVLALLIIPSDTAPKDYFTNLVLPLCGHAVWNLPERTAKRWVIGFCLFSLTSMLAYYGFLEGIGFGLTYVVGCLLIAILGSVTLQADQARNESQALLAELQIANQKLRDYARQIETLAAAEERNRLARELHDSVSQTIFSMNLTAQSARILLDRDPQRVAGLLDHLQVLSQNALGEMRSLIQQLRPHSLIENGLAAALRDHAAERLEQDNLKVEVQVKGEGHLPVNVEEGLYRIAQEALNNIVKHANTDKATISLTFENDLATLTIEDQGAGFDYASAKSATGHMGLSSMRERIESLGGNLSIDTAPGKGTRVKIEIGTGKEQNPEASQEMENQKAGKETEDA